MSANGRMKLSDPNTVDVTLTITLPLHAWEHILARGNYNPFHDAVADMIRKVRALESETEVDV